MRIAFTLVDASLLTGGYHFLLICSASSAGMSRER